jgi:hypothetical protein
MTIVKMTADITVRTRDGFGRSMGVGLFVDLDECVGDSDVTVREALGRRLDTCCELVDDAAPPSPFVDAEDEDGAKDDSQWP